MRTVTWKIAIGVALLVVCAYCPLWNAQFINYDDPAYVTSNPEVTAGLTWHGIKWAFRDTHTGNWHPVTWLSHMLDCQLFGLRPRWHHLISVIFHAANSVLIFALVRQMTGFLWRSALVAALFAVHPLHVESVAWISERKDVLSAFFGLLCLFAYARYTRSAGSRARIAYALSLVFFTLGLMSKPMLVTWPFVLLLLDFWPLRRLFPSPSPSSASSPDVASTHPVPLQKLILEKLPFLLPSCISCVVTTLAQKAGGAMPTFEQMPMTARIGNAIHSYVGYIWKLLFPHDLAVLYPTIPKWPASEVAFTAMILVGLTALAVAQRKQRPWLFVGWAWFTGTLVPVIGLVQVGNQAMADRYTYLPSVGFFVMIVWTVASFTEKTRLVRMTIGAFAAALVLFCAAGTATQAAYWRNSETLFRRAIAVTKNNFIAYNNLGSDLLERGKIDEAKTCFEHALAINPISYAAWQKFGAVLLEQGAIPEAINASLKALSLKPESAEAHATLAMAYTKQGRMTEGIAEYQAALRLRPSFAAAHYNLANALARQGNTDQAAEHYREAVRLDPSSADAHNNFGFMLARTGRFSDAIVQFHAALALQPTFWQARYGLGTSLEKIGRHEDAERELAPLRKEHPELFSK